MNEEQNTSNDDEVIKVCKNLRRITICVVEKWPFRKFSLAEREILLGANSIDYSLLQYASYIFLW